MTLSVDDAAALLSVSPDHRVLRRVPPVESWRLPAADGETVRAVLVDCETTGLSEADEVIELAVVPFDYKRATGRIVRVLSDQIVTGFREPSVPIPDESTRVHGITQEMVTGHALPAELVAASIADAQLVISHHAGFDRPMLERPYPAFEAKCWACTFADIDWRSEGLKSAKLDYLMFRLGWFFDGHRALHDVLATLWLLTLPLPLSGKPALGGLLERARRPLSLVQARDTKRDDNALLKARGYRWVADQKAWTVAVNDPAAEVEWLKAFPGWVKRSSLRVRPLPPKLRYSSRIFAAPKAAVAPQPEQAP